MNNFINRLDDVFKYKLYSISKRIENLLIDINKPNTDDDIFKLARRAGVIIGEIYNTQEKIWSHQELFQSRNDMYLLYDILKQYRQLLNEWQCNI